MEKTDTQPHSTQHETPAAEPYVTAAQVAEFLGLPENTVYKLALQRRLPSYRLGKSRRFRLSEVDAAMRAGRVDTGGVHE
jgi:excisionase family DNA binding protein